MSSSIKEPIVSDSKTLQPLSPNMIDESSGIPKVPQVTIPPNVRVETPSTVERSSDKISTSSSLLEGERFQSEDMEIDFEYTSEPNSSVKTSSTEQSIPQEVQEADTIVEPEETIVFVRKHVAIFILSLETN